MSKKSRVKGRLWEQTVARMLRPIFGESIKRGWQSRRGSDAPDIDGAPIWVECKHGDTTSHANPYKAVEQALTAANGRKPVVTFCKVGAQTENAQRYAPIMAVPLDFGLELLSVWWSLRKNERDFGEFVSAQRARGKIIDGGDDEDDEPDPLAHTPGPAITEEMPALTPPPVEADQTGQARALPGPTGPPRNQPGAALPPPPPLPPARQGS